MAYSYDKKAAGAGTRKTTTSSMAMKKTFKPFPKTGATVTKTNKATGAKTTAQRTLTPVSKSAFNGTGKRPDLYYGTKAKKRI